MSRDIVPTCLGTSSTRSWRARNRLSIPVRSLLEPSQPTRAVPTTTESTSRGTVYQLVITNAGSRPDRVAKVLRDSFDLDEGEAQQALGGTMPLIGGYATVEGARMAVQAAGGHARTVGPE
jgi:hypothetical protein